MSTTLQPRKLGERLMIGVRLQLQSRSAGARVAVARLGAHARPMLHLVIGPVGAGKSTFARELAREHDAVHLDLDEWMAVLFAADRPAADTMPWYVERTARCIEQIWSIATRVVATGTAVILEIGMILRSDRERLYARIDAAGLAEHLRIWVLDTDREIRRARVEQRNAERGDTFKMIVPPAIFELASDLWQPPDDAEIAGRNITWRES
jgi:predicted kinase